MTGEAPGSEGALQPTVKLRDPGVTEAPTVSAGTRPISML